MSLHIDQTEPNLLLGFKKVSNSDLLCRINNILIGQNCTRTLVCLIQTSLSIAKEAKAAVELGLVSFHSAGDN